MFIYNLGSLNIDYVYHVPHFVRPGETLASREMQIFPGGKGLNQSVALGRAGASVRHGGLINNNDKWLVDVLQHSNVDTSYIQSISSPSGHAIIQVDSSGQNSILLFAGANHSFTREYIETVLADAKKNDILLIQNEINHLELIFEIAHEKEMQIAFNPSPFDKGILDLPLSYVKWWICNEIEGNELSGKRDALDIVDSLLQKFPESNILLTLGKEGCIFKNASLFVSHPSYKVKAVDTTAAGDTFTGYFLAMIARGGEVDKALQIASFAAALAVSREGASSSIPFLEEVECKEAQYECDKR